MMNKPKYKVALYFSFSSPTKLAQLVLIFSWRCNPKGKILHSKQVFVQTFYFKL